MKLLRCTFSFLLAVMLCVAGPAAAQDRVPAVAVERQIYQAFIDEDYKLAAELIEKFLATSPDDAGMLYNAACAYSQLGDIEKAADYLLKSVKAGYRDFEQMESDPDLAAVRKHVVYQAIVEARKRAQAEQKRPQQPADPLERWKEKYGTDKYRYERDDKRRLLYVLALDEASTAQMRQMLERQADQLAATLFESTPAYNVVVAVPLPDDASRILGDPQIGGAYDHPRRQLIARDIGSSLRHEFVHLMHYGHMVRLQQEHPLWIQEGLASLYEDYEWTGDGRIKFLPNNRDAIAQHNARTGVAVPWKDLFVTEGPKFMDRASRLYPQVRSIFQFLADQGKLADWYKAYVKHFDDDPSGAKAFEVVFDSPLADVERAWKRWMASRPKVDITVRPGDAALGVETRMDTSNDGVLVDQVVRGSSAHGKLRKGDVIVSIDGQPTPSFPELTAIIASKKVGEEVTVRGRRNGEYFTVVLTLKALRPM